MKKSTMFINEDDMEYYDIAQKYAKIIFAKKPELVARKENESGRKILVATWQHWDDSADIDLNQSIRNAIRYLRSTPGFNYTDINVTEIKDSCF